MTANYDADYQFAACRIKDNTPAYAIESLDYLGDGKVGKSKFVKYLTTDEIVKKKYGMSCDELKNTTDPNLSYEAEEVSAYRIRKLGL